MSSDSQPDWLRLPDDPRGFFGLPLDFDRRALKLVYGQFIRRFKPEQHPAEFQQIRAAYEQLDLQLRYGAAIEEPANSSGSSWQAESSPTDAIVSRVAATPLHTRLQTESPEALYQELSGLASKSPFDYFALALLSDVVAPPTESRFATWLMAGIAQSPREPGLYHLLQLHFQGPMATDSLPKLLTQAARQVSELYFYPLTEKLWLQHLRENGFAAFRDSLARCLEFQPGIQIANRLTFYLQVLRHAIWDADADWIAQTIGYVEENFQHIPYQLGNEIDLLVALQTYAATRQQFIARHPLRAEMDAVIRSYFTEDEYLADRKMIACQEKLLADPIALGPGFPDFDEPGLNVFYSLWAWLSREAADRNFGELPKQYPDPTWEGQARALVSRVKHLANWTWLGIKWSLQKTGLIVVTVIGLFAPPILLTFVAVMIVLEGPAQSVDDPVLTVACITAIGVGLYIGYLFCGQMQRRRLDPLDALMRKRCYSEYWRPEVLALLERSHLPVPALIRFIGTSPIIVTRSHLIFFIEHDYALAFYSLAQRFVV